MSGTDDGHAVQEARVLDYRQHPFTLVFLIEGAQHIETYWQVQAETGVS